MEYGWFVVLSGGNGPPLPMTNDDEYNSLALFASEEEAIEAARTNPLGKAYGFQVYSWD